MTRWRAMTSSPDDCSSRSFLFERDTFAFANDLVWQYQSDPSSGAVTASRRGSPSTYSHRCFVMVRSARQFLYHARFEPALPAAETEAYRRLIRAVVSRNPRRASLGPDRVVVPGYDGLRSFSRAQEPLLKAECGGPWQSYFVRSHWRMVFPVWARHQERMAQRLERSLRAGGTPVVHLFRFPHITINHGIGIFGATASERTIEFDAYDPNIPEHPVKLTFERDRKTFCFPRTHYWAGGPVSVNEIYRSAIR